jgi:hypothetical protein
MHARDPSGLRGGPKELSGREPVAVDVWFCRAQEPMPRGAQCDVEHPGTVDSHALASVPGHPWLRLTDGLHGGRQTAPYSPEFEPDIVLTEPQPRHRMPPEWTRLCPPLVIDDGGVENRQALRFAQDDGAKRATVGASKDRSRSLRCAAG